MMIGTYIVWLADFHLTSFVLLAIALAAGSLVRQPAKRLVIAWAASLGIGILFLLAMLPGWSIWSLASPNDLAISAQPLPLADIDARPSAPAALPYAERSLASATDEAGPTLPPDRLQATDDTLSVLGLVPLAYLLGSLVTAGWLLIGWWLTRRLVREAAPTDGLARQLLHDLAENAPRLLLSDRLAGPVAVGLRRPTILLPRPMADRAEAEELRAVLTHELAHVRGGDLWLLATLRLLMVVLWCDPLFWLLRRRVRLDQETLADAAAAALSDRVGYAERLIGWARALTPQPRLAGAAGLWESPSQLSKRIALLLDDGFTVVRRSGVRWRAACGVACLALAGVGSLVTLGPAKESSSTSQLDRVEPSAAAQDEITTDAANRKAGAEATGEVQDVFVPITSAFPLFKSGEPNVVSGVCLDAAGKPLAGVEVLLLHRKSRVAPIDQVGRVRTGPDGRFRVERVIADADSLEFRPMAPPEELFYLVARREGYASRSLVQMPFQVARRGAHVAFRLSPAATLAGRVINSAGSPVEGARVSVVVNGSLDLGDPTMHAALTDADGRYLIRDLPQGDFAAQRRQQEQRLAAQEEEGAFGTIVVTLGEATVTHPEYAIGKKPLESVPGKLNFQLSPSAVVEGRLLHEEGKPLEGLGVQIHPDPLSRTSNKRIAFWRNAPIDADGNYRFESLPAGDYYLRVDGLYGSEFVSLAGQKVTAVTGETTAAPDLVVSDGRVVRFQLINKETNIPLSFDEPITAIAWYFLSGENPYGGSLSREVEVSRDGRFEFRIDNRAVRMGIALPLPTSDPNGAHPQFDVEAPAGDIEQPFMFPIDPEKVTDMRPRPSGVLETVNLLALEGKLDEAIDRLTQSLERNESNDPNLLLRRADYLAQASRHKEAIADYEAAIGQRPGFSFVLKNNLAYLLATVEDPELRDVQRAALLAREAVAESPPIFSAQAHDTLATTLEAAGDLPAAVLALEKAITAANDLQKQEFEEKLKELREKEQGSAE